MSRPIRAVLLLWLLLSSAGAWADEPLRHDEAVPFPTLLWCATQLLPSLSVAAGAGETSLHLRWQLTPLLYSWGVNPRVSGWRAFVVEPNFRYGGSVELFVSPELLLAERSRFLLRPGARAYFPIAERGEALSLSAGLSYQRVGEVSAVAVEAGAYILFGILGLQVSHAPGAATPARTLITLQIRYF